MKYQEVLTEISDSKQVKLIFTNFNDRGQDEEFKLTQVKLDRLTDVHDLLKFLAGRLKDDVLSGAMNATSGAILSGQPIDNEDYLDMHFAVDVKLGDSARGVSFIIKEDGTVAFKVRVDSEDRPGMINFDDNFLEFKAFIKKSLE